VAAKEMWKRKMCEAKKPSVLQTSPPRYQPDDRDGYQARKKRAWEYLHDCICGKCWDLFNYIRKKRLRGRYLELPCHSLPPGKDGDAPISPVAYIRKGEPPAKRRKVDSDSFTKLFSMSRVLHPGDE
jgi:hypothetical protein